MADKSEIVEIFVTDDQGKPEEGAKTFIIRREPKTGSMQFLGPGDKVSKIPDRTVGISRRQFESARTEEGIDILDAARILNEAEPAFSFSDEPTPNDARFQFRTQQLPIPPKGE